MSRAGPQRRSFARPRVNAVLACLVLAGVFAALLLAGRGTAVGKAPRGSVVGITERDFHISTSAASVPAGDVALRIHNDGPDQHELIVLPLHDQETPDRLPLRTDGFTVNEELLHGAEPGSIEPQQPGGTRYLQLHLAPGRYVLFCNMEGHYMGGMSTELSVTP